MNYIIKDTFLEIIYMPWKWAWTYHIEIPNTKNLFVRWGYTKVSWYIDDYEIKWKNLFSVKNQNKLLSINEKIRKYLGKNAGDRVKVSIYLEV